MKHRRRSVFLASLAALFLVSTGTAQAASLAMNVVGGNVFDPGDVITVEIFAVLTDSEPKGQGFDIRLLTDGGVSWTGATQVRLTSFDGGLPWTAFAPICPAGGGDLCVVGNQGAPVLPAGIEPDPFDGLFGTATGIVGTDSFVLEMEVNSSGPTWFGAPPADPIAITVTPEPSTAVLLALGLLGLAGHPARR